MSDPRGSSPRYVRISGMIGGVQRRARELQKTFKLNWKAALTRAKDELNVSPMKVKFTKTATLLSVVFDSTVTLNGRTVASYLWKFGDGLTAATADPTHVYGAAGTYTVTCKVTDTLGDSSYASWRFKVNAS